MSDIKAGDTVYFEDEKRTISETYDLLSYFTYMIKEGPCVTRCEIETEKEYFTRKLKEIEEEEKRPVWPLPENTGHWFIDAGSDEFMQFSETGLSDENYNQAISQERCRQLYKKSLLMQDVYLWVDTFYPDWRPDWSNIRQEKHGVGQVAGGVIVKLTLTRRNSFCFGISVPTKEAAEEMEKVFGERLKEWY